MIFSYLFCFVVLCSGYNVEARSNKLKMIVSFIEQLDKPTVVNAKVHWDLAKRANLISLLSKAKKSVTIKYADNDTFGDIDISDNFIERNFFLVDLQCPHINNFLKQSNFEGKFNLPNRWLILVNNPNISGIIPEELHEMHIFMDSEIVIARRELEEYKLYMIYKKPAKGDWTYEFYGTWSETGGLDKSKGVQMMTTFMRRKNFERLPIVSSFVLTQPTARTDLSSIRNHPGDSISVSGYRQVIHLFDFINATRSTIITNTWGYLTNGSWNGMTGHLVRGDAEFAGSVIFMNKQRIGILEYMNQPMKTNIRFVFRKPPLSYQYNLLLLPFNANVWACIGVFVAIFGVTIYLNSRWELWKTEVRDKKTIDNTILKPTFGDVTMFVMSAISQQGSYSELKGSLGRVVVLILYVAFLFIYTSYSACIVVLLQSTSNDILTLTDLLNSRLEIGVEDTPYNRYYFAATTEPVRRAIYETKIAPKGSKPNFMSLEEGVKKLRKEPFAFHMNTAVGYKFMGSLFREHEKCGFQEIAFMSYTKPWFTCRKTSHYKELLKIGVRRIQEHGLSERENNLVFSTKPVCYSAHGSFGSVNIRDCYFAFFVLLYGILLSLTIVVIEILMKKTRFSRLDN